MDTQTEDASAEQGADEGLPPRSSGFVRRHKALVVLFTILLVPTLVLGGWVLYLNHQVNEVSRFQVDLDRPGRPVRPAGEALTFLYVGVDSAQAGGSFQNTMKQQDLAGRLVPQRRDHARPPRRGPDQGAAGLDPP